MQFITWYISMFFFASTFDLHWLQYDVYNFLFVLNHFSLHSHRIVWIEREFWRKKTNSNKNNIPYQKYTINTTNKQTKKNDHPKWCLWNWNVMFIDIQNLTKWLCSKHTNTYNKWIQSKIDRISISIKIQRITMIQNAQKYIFRNGHWMIFE